MLSSYYLSFCSSSLPSPFYALDEVDMHLDNINVKRLSDMIINQSKNAQFMVVSLRGPMVDSADRMIGVTQKGEGVTKIFGNTLRTES